MKKAGEQDTRTRLDKFQKRKRVVEEPATVSAQVKKRKHEESTVEPAWSKSKKKRLRKLLAKRTHLESSESAPATAASTQQDAKPVHKEESPKKHYKTTEVKVTKQGTELQQEKPLDHRFKIIGKASSLQQAFMERLSGSRFRILNEELYTHSSFDSFQRFSSNPILFDEYHQGFRQQVKSWQENPIDWIFDSIVKFKQSKMLSSRSNLVVADFGCGEAMLAEKLLKVSQNHPSPQQPKKNTSSFVVHSLDLVSNGNPLITACDMAHTPLTTASVDIGVFCLSLMGTNVADFVREAYRVLRPDGVLKVAEVRSRFEEGSNNVKSKRHDQSMFDQFVNSMLQLGFRCTSKNQSNVMFVLLDFVKVDGAKPDPDLIVTLKPCIYKRR